MAMAWEWGCELRMIDQVQARVELAFSSAKSAVKHLKMLSTLFGIQLQCESNP
jgi:hypothetical protein